MMIQRVKSIFLHLSPLERHRRERSRGQERYRRAAWTAAASAFNRVIAISVGLITVPLTLGYLEKERYGLWMALSSLVAFLSFMDMGLGIGLQNALAECRGRDDKNSPQTFVSSGFAAILLVCLILVLACVFVLPFVPWDRLVKTGNSAVRSELLPTAQAVLLCFVINLPAALVQRIYDAHQQGYWGSLWLAIGRIVSLGGVLVCVHYKLGLVWLVMAAVGLPALPLMLGGVVLFVKQPWLIPSWRGVRYDAFRKIFHTGSGAVVAQLGAAALYCGPAVVVANRLSLAEVTPFSLAQKLVSTAAIILSTMILPLWPAYGEAAARGDWPWIRRTIMRSAKLGFAVQIPVFVGVLLVGQWVIGVWTRRSDVIPSSGLLLAVNCWYLLAVVNLVTSVALNGLNHMWGQATYGSGLVCVGLGVAYLLAPLGPSAAIWPVALISMGVSGLCQCIELRRVLRRAAGGQTDAVIAEAAASS